MKHSLTFVGTLAVVCSAVAPIATNRLLAASEAVAAGRLPIDLARGSLGAKLEVRTPKGANSTVTVGGANQSAQGLISDDASLSYPLADGTTSMILTLRKADVLSRLNFINYGAEGELTISASATKLPFESKDWRPASKSQVFSGEGTVGCDLGSLEARYIKIDFQTRTPGRISGLGVFGLMTINSLDPHPVSAYQVTANLGVNTPSVQGENVYFDYANLNTGAKVVGVSGSSSVDSAQTMLDGNVETNFSFSATDPSPTVVVDLGVRRALNRVSCVYEAPAGRIDFYLVDNPYTKDYQRSVSLSYTSAPTTQPPTDGVAEFRRIELAKHKAVCSIETTGRGGITHASANIGAASGRFMVAEFHPSASAPVHVSYNRDFKDTDFKDTAKADDAKDFKDKTMVADEGQPFRLVALSGFGDHSYNDNISRVPNTPPNMTQVPNGSAQPPVVPGSSGIVIISP